MPLFTTKAAGGHRGPGGLRPATTPTDTGRGIVYMNMRNRSRARDGIDVAVSPRVQTSSRAHHAPVPGDHGYRTGPSHIRRHPDTGRY
jgi:hypothetical protein